MKILVINAGSSSIKYQLFDMDNEHVLAKGACERIGTDGAFIDHKKTDGPSFRRNERMDDHKMAMKHVLEALTDPEYGVIKDMSEIGAVGHRVVHSGLDFTCSVPVTREVLETCKKNYDLAPLHVPANVSGAEACLEVMPNTPMTLVFDTAFHTTMPPKAYMYGLPYEAYTDWKIRKYGFHGTSHKYVSQEAAKFLGKDIKDLKIVTCHLGNGSSLCAVNGGKCVDTSMGFTPLAGVCMGTRCGDIDPSLVEYISNKSGMTVHETVEYLNKKSGVLGLSGFSSDFRDLAESDRKDEPRAKLAVEVFSYQVKKFIGSYVAAMNGLDCLVFTAGVGEHTAKVRELVCEDMTYFGIELDDALNNNGIRGQQRCISKKGSKVPVLIIPTNEELVIARETLELVTAKK